MKVDWETANIKRQEKNRSSSIQLSGQSDFLRAFTDAVSGETLPRGDLSGSTKTDPKKLLVEVVAYPNWSAYFANTSANVKANNPTSNNNNL